MKLTKFWVHENFFVSFFSGVSAIVTSMSETTMQSQSIERCYESEKTVEVGTKIVSKIPIIKVRGVPKNPNFEFFTDFSQRPTADIWRNCQVSPETTSKWITEKNCRILNSNFFCKFLSIWLILRLKSIVFVYNWSWNFQLTPKSATRSTTEITTAEVISLSSHYFFSSIFLLDHSEKCANE